MHFSDLPSECGNIRTYETPAHGMMMVCDKAGVEAHSKIFEPGKEAIYYDSLDHAIELIEHYLHYNDERVNIAKAGYERFWRDYEWEKNLLKFLRWCENVRDMEVT
jgi:spore maturation protein CgeB